MVHNIIFDFDGTLVDTSPVILATMAATIKELGLPERSEQECRQTIGLRLKDIPSVLFPEIENLENDYVLTYRRLFNMYNQQGLAQPYPGVVDTLRRLKHNGVDMAIASSRSRASLTDFCEKFGIAECFGVILGGEDVTNGKPNPEPVLKILSEMGWEQDATMVVGDTTFDIDMGSAAGVKTCGVTYGNHTIEQLKESNPTWMIDDFAKLVEILRGE